MCDFRAALSILFATGLCSRAVTQDLWGQSPQECGGTKLGLEKLTEGRHGFLQGVQVCCCLLSLLWEREEYPHPSFPGLLRLAWPWCGTHWAVPHLSMTPLPGIGLAHLYMYFYVYIYIKSCVCVHVYAYPHVYIAHCGFTEKCESSWPQ